METVIAPTEINIRRMIFFRGYVRGPDGEQNSANAGDDKPSYRRLRSQQWRVRAPEVEYEPPPQCQPDRKVPTVDNAAAFAAN